MEAFYHLIIGLCDRFKWELRNKDRRIAQHHEKMFCMYKKYQAHKSKNKFCFMSIEQTI